MLVDLDDVEERGAFALVADYLRRQFASKVCLVQVEQAGRRYTIVLEPEWVGLARQIESIDASLVADLELPRAAICAVIALWPQDWVAVDATDLVLDLGPDGLPRVAFAA
jgi:hypothetical protein